MGPAHSYSRYFSDCENIMSCLCAAGFDSNCELLQIK